MNELEEDERGKEMEGEEDVADDNGESGPLDGKFAKKVVNELYERYNTLRERKSAYKDLLLFLIYVSFNLSMLYLQRDASAAYSVVSTIQGSGLTPQDTETSTVASIYEHIQTVIDTFWVNPVCGDDKCEDPFEFAFYGRFGCKADCGTLGDYDAVTPIQVDLYFDFHHAQGSTPATTLMQAATWNLCPADDSSFFDVFNIKANKTKIKHIFTDGTACYFEDPQTYASLEGHINVVIADVPDGEWEIVAQADNFRKVRGAVRDRALVVKLAQDLKLNNLSRAVAEYKVGQEWHLHNESLNELLFDNLTVAFHKLEVVHELEVAKLEADMIAAVAANASLVNSSRVEFLAAAAEFNVSLVDSKAVATAVVQLDVCSGLLSANATSTNLMFGNRDNETGKVYCGWPVGAPICLDKDNLSASLDSTLSITSDSLLWEDDFNLTKGDESSECDCQKPVDTFCRWFSGTYDYHIADIRTDLLSISTKVAAAGDQLEKEIISVYRVTNEALAFEISASRGRDVKFPIEVSTTVQTKNYVTETRDLSNTIQQLIPFNFANKNVTWLIDALQARVTEAAEQLPGFESLQRYNYGMTRVEIMAHIRLWDANATSYLLQAWPGSVDEYLTCDLRARADLYAGACVPLEMRSTLAARNTQLIGTTDSEKQQECAKLCYCDSVALGGDCDADNEMCACEACEMKSEEMDDLWAIQTSGPAPAAKRYARNLLAEDATLAMYTDLLSEIQVLANQQTTLSTQVMGVSDEQGRQNEAATEHHQDTGLKDTITAGFSDMQASYDVLQGQMNELLSKQDLALAAQAKFSANLARQTALFEQQAASLGAIERAVARQLEEIKAARAANQITNEQERVYRWRAALDKEFAQKNALLANFACDISPAAYNFDLENFVYNKTDAARERLVGINNRVVAGMLLYTTRNRLGNCSTTRFSNIENECIKGRDPGHSYGVDPVFKSGEDLYDSDLASEDQVIKYYNCSDLETASYPAGSRYAEDGVKGIYCQELYNENQLPYGFHYLSMQNNPLYKNGFPVFFDINLNNERANDYFGYVQQGYYIDEDNTRDVTAQLLTYNAELRTFANVKITWTFAVAGKIDIKHAIQAVRVELYTDAADKVRLAMEILMAVFSVMALAIEMSELVESRQKYGTVKAYFRSAWNYIDLLSITIQIVCTIYWWIFVFAYALPFDVSPKPGGRYEVYADLDAKANFLRLGGSCYTDSAVPDGESVEQNELNCKPNLVRGKAMQDLGSMLNDIQKCGDILAFYMTLSGINIILMISRSLKLMDFQPRLGIVTKTLARASSDILHFMVVFGVVFMGYVMMGTLVFGYKIKEFSSLSRSLRTCFETLLGEIGWNEQLYDLDDQLEYMAGFAYFWSYQILVFMILLNFLLAIIVDAYGEIKEESHDHVSVHQEVIPMIQEKWKTLTKSKYFYRKHIPEDRIRKSLKVLAGRGDEESDSEESIDFDLNPERVLKVGDEDIDKETLRRVLQHCIAYAEEKAGIYDLQKGPQPASTGMLSCLKGSNENANGAPPLFTAQDVNGAVDMLILQHGDVKQKADEDDEEEEEDADVKELMEKMQELIKGQDDLMRGQRKLEELEDRLLKVIELPPDANK